jgi:glycine oxidase
VKSWDAVIIGAGIIGLSLAIELNRRGRRVLVVDKGEPRREASWAAGGMLCDSPLETQPALRDLAVASATMYPEFVGDLERESGLKIDLRSEGTLFFAPAKNQPLETSYPLPQALSELEPELRSPEDAPVCLYLKEHCVDPRELLAAAERTARGRGVEFCLGVTVEAVMVSGARARGVATQKETFQASTVINCAGAWAGQISPIALPTRPVKGHMLSVSMPGKNLLRHVVRTPDIYLIPRSDGRLVIGATSEEAGFDRQVVPETIETQRRAAVGVVPALANAPVMESWTGLRPGTPDKLPIMGATSVQGYFVATGHYRDGILLAPVTARAMGQVIAGDRPGFDLTAFGVERFPKPGVN